MWCYLLFFLSVAFLISLDPTLWISSEIHHFYIEFIAIILGSALSFYYLLRSRVLDDKFSLFVGIDFCICVTIELFHVITLYALVEHMSFLKYFIPQTWFAGRFFLGTMLLIAILKYSVFKSDDIVSKTNNNDYLSLELQTTPIKRKNEKSDIIFYIALLSIVGFLTAFSSLFLSISFICGG